MLHSWILNPTSQIHITTQFSLPWRVNLWLQSIEHSQSACLHAPEWALIMRTCVLWVSFWLHLPVCFQVHIWGQSQVHIQYCSPILLQQHSMANCRPTSLYSVQEVISDTLQYTWCIFPRTTSSTLQSTTRSILYSTTLRKRPSTPWSMLSSLLLRMLPINRPLHLIVHSEPASLYIP